MWLGSRGSGNPKEIFLPLPPLQKNPKQTQNEKNPNKKKPQTRNLTQNQPNNKKNPQTKPP